MSKEIIADLSKNGRLQKILTLMGSITHEARSYLTTIKNSAELSEIAIKKNLKVIQDANYFMTNMQLQLKGVFADKPITEGFERYSIAKNVQEAIEQYPFVAYEKSLVVVMKGDFKYVGSPVLTSHILYKLFKNAFRAIKNANKGNITIKFKTGVKYNELIFRDTATGIPAEFLPKMFKLFENKTTTQNSMGLGLAFCKMTMQSYGGDITCDSVEGEYTEFVLRFPVIK